MPAPGRPLSIPGRSVQSRVDLDRVRERVERVTPLRSLSPSTLELAVFC